MLCHDDVIVADWPAPPNVHVVNTTRRGGVSAGPYASLNLATHVGDDAERVAENRRRLAALLSLPAEPRWLEQVHGCAVVDAAQHQSIASPCADASFTATPGVVCAVLTADCLPIVLCDRAGREVAVAHAGWRGLAAGVVEQTVTALSTPPPQLLAWLGPAIGSAAFEVGDEVRRVFVATDATAVHAFLPSRAGHWFADLYTLARQRLARIGVTEIYGGGWCTWSAQQQFFSYRRDQRCGRMATLAWRSA